MAIAEELRVIIRAETQNAVKNLSGIQKKLDATEKVSKTLASTLKGVGAGLISAFAAQAVLNAISQFGKASSRVASAAEEIRSKFNTVFKDAAASTEKWAREYSASIGRSSMENMKFLATLQDTFVPLGFARRQAADMSKEVVKLATDLASFNNLPTETVIRDIQSALVGNTETLRKYGIVAMQTQIDQEALNSGLIKNKVEMTANTKAQAIMNIAMRGSVDAMGDAVRTADSFANVQVAARSATLDLQEAVGNYLNPGIKQMNLLYIAAVKEISTIINKSLEYQKVAYAFAAGQEDQLTTEQRLIGYRQQLVSLQGTYNYLTDENQRGMRAIAGENEATAQKRAEEISRDIRNLNGMIRATEALAAAEKKRAEEEEDAAAKRLQDAERRNAEILKQGNYLLFVSRDWAKASEAMEEGLKPSAAMTIGPETYAQAWAEATEAAEMTIGAHVQNVKSLGQGMASDMIDAYGPLVYIADSSFQAVTEAAKDSAAQMAAAYSAAYSTISTGVMDLWSMQLQYNRQVGDAEIKRLNNQLETFKENYAAELRLKEDLGIDTIAFQEEMNERQAALEEAVQQRQNAIKKRMFEQEKKLSIAQTIMSGAEAAIKAYAQLGAFGAPVAALIAAFTAAKVGMIQSQKYPALAEGGIVNPTPGGSLVRVAEAGKPEAIVPLDRGFGNITVIINADVVGGREEVSMWVHEGILRAQKMGRI